MYVCMYVCMHVRTYISTPTTLVRTYVHGRRHARTHMCILCIHAYLVAQRQSTNSTQAVTTRGVSVGRPRVAPPGTTKRWRCPVYVGKGLFLGRLFTRVYVHTYIHTYIRMYIHSPNRVCMCVKLGYRLPPVHPCNTGMPCRRETLRVVRTYLAWALDLYIRMYLE